MDVSISRWYASCRRWFAGIAVAVMGLAGTICNSNGFAREIFVNSNAGDDAQGRRAGAPPGSLASRPLQTLEKAIRVALPGDRIVLQPNSGPYRESVSIVGVGKYGRAMMSLEIEGNGNTFDGRAAIDGEWRRVSGNMFRAQPRRLGAQLLYVGEQPGSRVASVGQAPVNFDFAGWSTEKSLTPPKLQPLQWSFLRGMVYFECEQGRLPQDYDLSVCDLTTGITIYQTSDVVVRNLTIQGFHSDGLHVHDATGVRLENVNLRGNARAGLAASGAARVIVNQCVLGDNGQAQIMAASAARTGVRQSEIFDASAPASATTGGEVYEIE